MRQFDRLVSSLASGFHIVASAAIIAMMIHVSADVLMKYAANRPIEGTLEFVSTYYMVSIVFLPLALVTRNEAHVTVELAVQTLRPAHRHFVSVLASMVSSAYCLMLCWRGSIAALRATRVGEVWESTLIDIPIWPTRWMYPLGTGLAALMFLVVAARHLRAARSGVDDITRETA